MRGNRPGECNLRAFPLADTSAAAHRVAQAYERWGKGVHPAGLNFGDCFAYEVATEHRCRLLYVGADFDRTDVARVLEGG